MDYKLCDGEYHLMEIVWELEPVTSTDYIKNACHGWAGKSLRLTRCCESSVREGCCKIKIPL